MSGAERRPLVLMAENDALVGLELCDALARAGFRVAGPLGTNAEALAWLARGVPATVILDVALRDGPSDDLALALRRRGVRFLVHAERDGAAIQSAAFAGAPWLRKPAWPQDVIETMRELTVQARTTGSGL